ncbi:MAG: Manganese transport system membrane protein MntB [Chlamydiae bacterium]|nr:Manganese transport system membrane protein MntB [Chlamydiota bacterium]
MFDIKLLLLPLVIFFLASISSGVIGSFIVVKRLTMMAASISHSVLGGMGLFLFLNRSFNYTFLTPLLGAIIAALLFATIMGLVHLKLKQRQDVILSCVWILGMSLGVLFLAKTPGYNVELMHFLFGNVLFSTWGDVIYMSLLALVLVTSFLLFYTRFNAIFFDETQSQLQKISITFWMLFLFVLIGLTTVMLIQVVGILLVMALLSLPSHLSSLFAKSLKQMVVYTFCFCFGFCLIGFLLAIVLDVPVGAFIALFSAIVYLIIIGTKKVYA